MKNVVFLMMLVAGVVQARIGSSEDYVFSADGTNVISVARALPSVGVTLDDGRVVPGLHVVGDALKLRCGWYRCNYAVVVPAGMRIKRRRWVLENGGAIVVAEFERIPAPPPRRISKLKLLRSLKKVGRLTDFLDFVKADAEREAMWNAAQFLSEDDDIVVSDISALAALWGMSVEQLKAVIEMAVTE